LSLLLLLLHAAVRSVQPPLKHDFWETNRGEAPIASLREPGDEFT